MSPVGDPLGRQDLEWMIPPEGCVNEINVRCSGRADGRIRRSPFGVRRREHVSSPQWLIGSRKAAITGCIGAQYIGPLGIAFENA